MSMDLVILWGYGVELDNSDLDYTKITQDLNLENEEDFRSSLLELDICERFISICEINGHLYVVYEPTVPWKLEENERNLTEDHIVNLIYKTLNKFAKDELTLEWVSHNIDFVYDCEC